MRRNKTWKTNLCCLNLYPRGRKTTYQTSFYLFSSNM
uniref:Uncharacterized protein n=1 Tax=Populus trichocarpa TaxID=3694 RepID=A0A3N7GE07_POPTR